MSGTDHHETIHVTHFHAWRRRGLVQLDWRLKTPVAACWRVLRSETGFAPDPDPTVDQEQTLISEGTDSHVGDASIHEDGVYFYTVFGRADEGPWQRVAHAKVRQGSLLRWFAHDVERQQRADQELADGDAVGTTATLRAEAEQVLQVFPGQPTNGLPW